MRKRKTPLPPDDNLTERQRVVLQMILQHEQQGEPLTTFRLSSLLGISPAGARATVSRLEKLGKVLREPAAKFGSGRVIKLVLQERP